MLETASKPIRMFLDFNAVIVNLDSLTPEGTKVMPDEYRKQRKSVKIYMEEIYV